MGIFSRVSDIANANINALLDKAEDPEKMVRLMIIEMEETLVEVRTTSARMIADKKTLQRKAEQLRELAADWERKAEMAIKKGREDLAKAALVEKNSINEDLDIVEEEINEHDVQIGKLGKDVDHLQLKLSDAKARQKSLVMRAQSNRSRLHVRKHLDKDQIDEALARFERYERKLDELEGEVEAFDLGNKSLYDEFADLENEEKIADELAELKARMSKKNAAKSEPDSGTVN
ncbi:MAG: phage shock protein PspA [Pseudomonadota bacterium]